MLWWWGHSSHDSLLTHPPGHNDNPSPCRTRPPAATSQPLTLPAISDVSAQPRRSSAPARRLSTAPFGTYRPVMPTQPLPPPTSRTGPQLPVPKRIDLPGAAPHIPTDHAAARRHKSTDRPNTDTNPHKPTCLLVPPPPDSTIPCTATPPRHATTEHTASPRLTNPLLSNPVPTFQGSTSLTCSDEPGLNLTIPADASSPPGADRLLPP